MLLAFDVRGNRQLTNEIIGFPNVAVPDCNLQGFFGQLIVLNFICKFLSKNICTGV